MIDGIRVEFEGGRAVKIDADQGADALRAIAAKDDGWSFLGELALVDGEGRDRTARHGLLRDPDRRERREPHRARQQRTKASWRRTRTRRGSTARIHVDFMIGSPELDVDGITAAGGAVPLLRGGAWQA